MTATQYLNSPVRNCRNCAHRLWDMGPGDMDRCLRTGYLCSTSVSHDTECGSTLRYWQPKPPRRSLRQWLYDLLLK